MDYKGWWIRQWWTNKNSLYTVYMIYCNTCKVMYVSSVNQQPATSTMDGPLVSVAKSLCAPDGAVDL